MDASKAVMAAASEAALLRSESSSPDDALEVLVNPVKRLRAELDWLPGASAEQVNSIRSSIRKSVPADTDGLSGISLINAILCNFALGDKFRYRGARIRIYHTAILDIARAFDEVDSAGLLADINRARAAAGVAPAEESQLKTGLKEKRERIRIETGKVLERLSASEYCKLFNLLADDIKEDRSDIIRPVLNDLFDRYEINTYAEVERLADKVRGLAEKAARGGIRPPMLVRADVNRLNSAMLDWERAVRPLEIREVISGKAYAPVQTLAEILIRTINVMPSFIDIKIELAEKCVYVFRETPEAADMFSAVIRRKDELRESARDEKVTNLAVHFLWIIAMAVLIAGVFALNDWIDRLTGPPPAPQPVYDVQFDREDFEEQQEELRRRVEDLQENGTLPAETEGENAEN